jgi:hypothetical protein
VITGFLLVFFLFLGKGCLLFSWDDPGEIIPCLLFCLSLDAKGAPIMTLVSLTDCCRLLVIDPKTLRRWLSHCGMSAQPHPLDARCKCVTREQVEQLAAVHRRTLPDQEGLHVHPEPSALSTPAMSAPVLSDVLPDVSAHIASLSKQLVGLQAHVATLEHHLALLVEQLQKEQQWRTSQAETFEDKSLESAQDKSSEVSQDQSWASSQDKSLESAQDKSSEVSQDQSWASSQDKSLDKEPALPSPSIDRRKHPHVLPLVEYGAQGKYVMISPSSGLLELSPDSPEWFAWLSTLPSFRFVGQHGRFTAFRGYQCSPSTPWWAHRQIRTRSYKRRLGTTAFVTIESLELAAASLQALV